MSVGKPLVTEGEFGAFVATVPVRIDWLHGTLALAQQHCFYQTGHGIAEEGCEGSVQGVEHHPVDGDLTFVRLFVESRESQGMPAHVVVKPESRVEFLASKVRVRWEDAQDAVHLGVEDDLWLKVRIDGREGWIHTTEDFNALGLQISG